MAAPVALGQIQAALFERTGERLAVVRYCPAILHHAFQVMGIEASALGLLPFGQREIARVAFPMRHEAARHFPAVLNIQLPRYLLELRFVEIYALCRHGFGIDP